MTSREESNALDFLQQLLAGDLSKAAPEALMRGIRDSEMARRRAQDWTGRLVRALRENHPQIAWSVIERETGAKKATLDRRATQLDD